VKRKVLILYTVPPDGLQAGRQRAEFDLSVPVRSVAQVLPEATVAGIRGEARELLELLSRLDPDVVFNACEAPLGRPDLEAHCAALFEWLGIPFTGSGSETLTLCRRKDFANAVLAAAGVPLPRIDRFPCIVKPAAEDGSAGIHAHSVCADRDALARARQLVDGPVIVQEFLNGREFAVSLWGPVRPDWFSIGEVKYRNGLQLITYAAKWDEQSADFANSPVVYDSDIEPALQDAIVTSARGAWRALGLRGYARVDVRLDARGIPCVLDVNPNPDLSPGAGIHRGVMEAGWTWERFVGAQIEWASTSASS
jgi:D-alanine-D-alanine ligase